ncbi:carboxypeptidase-like regulatory domain-containing protein [Subsaxibacter sp. CAU 1640]|uniref:carboxypeptidase-like regulatory domain-containing protein n=1 Tax=Subsaxibacter sp. CAU 1640 TaxID=2933271 RepID=UPI002003ADD9|nr:carboxypeptidase-like regulatory domain-containing protein [Subsaxibacter sp. CAU 1640]MCK7590172.1 carboxypeptidase-like regulatory domain-containing protein [Subsaxibacter sp. CAU 1640]
MERIKCCLFLFFFFSISFVTAQSVQISGKVIVDDDEIEGIHVINKTANKFTITQEDGKFVIPAQQNDTIIFSAIKYKPKEIIVDAIVYKAKTLTVYLTEQVNELDEVIVGKVLTGNLTSDIENSEAKRDINFYDLGIPGYTGKPLTQSERRYNEATTGGGIVPLNPILNYFSGRTKMLKNQIKIERLNECLERIKADLSNTFFEYNELDEEKKAEFFYFCLEDEEFETICKLKNDIHTLEFLQKKLDGYKTNLQIKKD